MDGKADSLVYLINAEQLGIGEVAPGKNLMNNFIYALTQHSTVPDAILLLNTGVRLATVGSDALGNLKKLSERGCQILSCGMCLNYYEAADRLCVGRVSNMIEITGIIAAAARTVTL